jgi:hypothetical protein
VATGKPDDRKIEDIRKLNDEMAEGKSPEVVAKIYHEGDKYYCAECHSELPVYQSCPNCHIQIDWDRFISESVPRA